MGSHAARRSRRMGLQRGCWWKSRLIVFALAIACANSQDISTCCAKATGTCRSVCEKMSLVEIASNSSMREERIQNIYKFCTPSLIEFWICMNVTIQEVVSGSGWWGRACCALGRSTPCRQACATAAGTAALAPVCRRSDEIAFFNCVVRQEEAQACCSQTQSLTCNEACKRVLWRVGTAHVELSAREHAVEACEQSPPLLHCLRDLTASTVHADTSKYLPCCHEAPSQECRTSCEAVLRRTGDSQEIAEILFQDCGSPAIHNGLWQCFLRKDEPPDTKDLIPHDVAKLHCCNKATTINCRRLCFNTFNTDWQNNWQKFYAECLGEPQETDLNQCMEEVEAPCSLGCAGLTYCSQLNNRPTSLFRSCSAQTDLDAHLAVAEQRDSGYVTVSGLRLPLKNSSQCPTDIWKNVACALHVKPCTAKGHASLLCAADCTRLVSSCVEWARAPPALNAAALCARLAPAAPAAPCVSLTDYMSPSKWSVHVQGHASLLCAADCTRLVSSCVEWARAPPALNAAALCARLAPAAPAAPCVSLTDYMSPSKWSVHVQGHASLLCAADCTRLVSSCVEWARAPPALNAAALCARLAPAAPAAPCVSLTDYMSPSKWSVHVQGHASLLCAADCTRLVSSCVEWARAPPALNAAALCARLAPAAPAAPCVSLTDYMSPSKWSVHVQGHASLLCAADCTRLVSSCVEWARAPPALNAAALCARLAPAAPAAPCVSLTDYMSPSKWSVHVQGHASLLCAADCTRLVSSCVEWARAPPALNAAALCARLAPAAPAAPCVSLTDYMSPSKWSVHVQGHASLLCAADCTRLVSSCVEWARAPPALNAAALCARLAPAAPAAPCVSLTDYMSPSKWSVHVQGHASLLCAADCTRLVSSCVEWARAPPALNAAALCARLAPAAPAAPCVSLTDYMSPSKWSVHVQGHASLLCAADCTRLVSSCVEWARAPPALNAAALCARLAPAAPAAPCVSLTDYMSPSLDPPLLSSREAVTSPCAGSPCNATQVCVVNRNCLQGGSCSRYTCIDGCPLGDGSLYIVPLGSWARVPMPSPSGKACYKICHCTNKGLGHCQPLPCIALDNCRLHEKVIMHGEKYYMECNACACVVGERVCARRACPRAALLTGLPCNCPPHHLPVEASGRRYPNACLAKCAGATDAEIEFGIRSLCASAACGRRACLPARNVCLSRLQASCPQHVCVNTSHCNGHPPLPVCDTDGHTHVNPCHLVISGNRFAYWGQCLERCSKVGSVCGANGITYISECAAWSEYVSVDYRGPCLAVGPISDLMEPKCQVDRIFCPPLIKPNCLGFTSPGACCPKCGGALRILYSKKQIDRALYGTNISSSVINLKNVLSALERQVKIAECALRGYLTIEMEIFVTVETILENPTDLQLRVCVLEAEKLAELINRESPIISSDLGLSALSYALTVHTYPTDGASTLSVSLLAVMISSISIFVLR